MFFFFFLILLKVHSYLITIYHIHYETIADVIAQIIISISVIKFKNQFLHMIIKNFLDHLINDIKLIEQRVISVKIN